MPARRRTSPVPVVRRPKVAGTTPAGRPEGDGEGPTLTGVRTPRPTGRSARARTQPADADQAGRSEDPLADGSVAAPAVAAPAVAAPAEAAPADAAPAEAAPAEAGDPVLADLTERTDGGDAGTDDGTPAAPRGRRRLRRDVPDGEPTAVTGPGLVARLRTVPVLAAALVVLIALAAFFGIATASLRGTPAAANSALTDLAATSEVSTQLGDALEVLYSYDFARLDENERAARDVITEGFTPEFERLFAQVRELAPQQQAVVSAVVSVSAVQAIEGDRAVLVAFMDQQATTAASAEQVAAAGRLTVTGELVDGRWKIAAVESR
jgi:Mce-associated membrane protein